MTADRPGPLSGLRVVDAATLYAGPFISTLLGDHGADVIKIEPPGGDPYRTDRRPLWAVLGRNKRSVTIDLQTDDGCDLLRRLVPRIDVLIVNLLPHQLERRGLTWDRLSAINPDLVLVCVTSFGLDGPRARQPGSGTLGEAYSGLTHLTGVADGKPMLAAVPVGDAVTGWVGAFGVLAACMARAAGRGGQLVDVNPVEAMMHLAAPALAEWTGGTPPGRLGGRLPGSPVRNTYRCRDGVWVAISASTPRHLTELMELAGHTAADGPDDGSADAAIAEWTAGLCRDDVIEQLGARRLPVAPVHDAESIQRDPQIVARGAVQTVQSTELGPRAVAAPAPRFAGVAPVAPRCADTGEDNEAVLRGLLGLDDDELARLRAAGVIGPKNPTLSHDDKEQR